MFNWSSLSALANHLTPDFLSVWPPAWLPMSTPAPRLSISPDFDLSASLSFELVQTSGTLIHTDTARRDTLVGTGFDDIFKLQNDGIPDIILSVQDGVDLIDITALDASFDQLQIKRLSATEYVVDYLNEERIFITFNAVAPEDMPASGILLDETDFIYRDGLPKAVTQVIFEEYTDRKEVLYGTTNPDIFILQDDNLRDTIRLFEPGKDRVDLSTYNTTFDELKIIEKYPGRVAIKVPSSDNKDKLVLIDVSHDLTADDISADMFIF